MVHWIGLREGEREKDREREERSCIVFVHVVVPQGGVFVRSHSQSNMFLRGNLPDQFRKGLEEMAVHVVSQINNITKILSGLTTCVTNLDQP